MAEINAVGFDACNARRKADRETLAHALSEIAAGHGANVERREFGANPGFSGHSTFLVFQLGGVGVQIDIDDALGGSFTIASWFGYLMPRRKFTAEFIRAVGDPVRPLNAHHKATTVPQSWSGLAKAIDAGLALARDGKAFEEGEGECG